MTLIKFNNLSLKQKTDTVWEWGFFIASVKHEDFTAAIFLLGDFLAEVNISISENETKCVKAFPVSESNSELPVEFKNNPLLKQYV